MVVYGASGLVPPEDLEEEAIAEMNALRRRSLEQRGLGSIFKKIIKGSSIRLTLLTIILPDALEISYCD